VNTEYYVIKNPDTGLYFRGKGVNRWGKHFNQASIYRVKGSADFSCKEIVHSGEKAVVVPIRIEESECPNRTETVYEFEARLHELLYTIPTVYNSHFRKLISQVVERMLKENV
jgi:hypothetical protein